jgi:hypothetical protein
MHTHTHTHTTSGSIPDKHTHTHTEDDLVEILKSQSIRFAISIGDSADF